MQRRPNPQRIRRGRRGFTLVEVLLVLVILVMLGSLAVGVYSQVQLNAMKKSAKAQINSFKTWIELYQQDMLAYPPDLQALVFSDGLNTPERWNGPYMEQVPLDPWGNQYIYCSPGVVNQNKPYEVYSCGPNGQNDNGGADDIGSWM